MSTDIGCFTLDCQLECLLGRIRDKRHSGNFAQMHALFVRTTDLIKEYERLKEAVLALRVELGETPQLKLPF